MHLCESGTGHIVNMACVHHNAILLCMYYPNRQHRKKDKSKNRSFHTQTTLLNRENVKRGFLALGSGGFSGAAFAEGDIPSPSPLLVFLNKEGCFLPTYPL